MLPSNQTRPPLRHLKAILKHQERLAPARRAHQFPRAISRNPRFSSSLSATSRLSWEFSPGGLDAVLATAIGSGGDPDDSLRARPPSGVCATEFLSAALLTLGAPASAATATATATVSGGALSLATSATPSFGVTLDGTDQTGTYTVPSTVTDARGTSAGWNLTLTSTQFSTGGITPSTSRPVPPRSPA